MKIFTKGIIVLFIINSMLGSLKEQGIITGKVSINYKRLFKNFGDNICIEFTASENTVPFRSDLNHLKYDNRQETDYLPNDSYYEEKLDADQKNKYHILQHGETLMTVSHKYGISCREIQELNRIRNVRKIRPGQRILIPGQFVYNLNT